jgi:transposase
MIRAGFLDPESRRDLIELTQNGSVEHRLARRANALVLLDDGLSCEAIAKVLFLDDDTIRTWYRLYQEDGIDGLAGFGFGGSACRLSDSQQARLKTWIAETLPRTTREVGAWIETECSITYESRSGLIALLHRLDMEHRKPKAVSSKLDPDKQAAFIKSYENLLNQIGDDAAVLFADAVHPTHAVRPVGCWAPKDTPLAVPQTSGRQRLNIHGAIDLETGKTRMIEAATVNAISMIMLLRAIEAMYPGKRMIHLFVGQRPLPPRQAGAGVAGATGMPHQAPLHPRLLSAPGFDRTALGLDAQACHPQSMSCDVRRLQSGDPHVPARGGAQKMGYLLRSGNG